MANWAFTSVNELIPYFAICACYLWGSTRIVNVNIIIWALTSLILITPYFTSFTWIFNTKIAIPDSLLWTLTTSQHRHPYFPTFTFLLNHTNPTNFLNSILTLTSQRGNIPNFPILTHYTLRTIPFILRSTYTFD